MRSSRTRALVLVVALVGLTELATATAHADAVDDAFLNAVRSHGINFASPQAAIMAGHQVCNALDSGRQKSDVAGDVAVSSSLDGYRAGYFVGVSIAAYCPRHHSQA
ncbi:hypothetical protein MULP_01391 [Mycobacterium liflandii 128FXT]|uniref:DUF732 domain-containing protein n=1 Tax=Mycobacterium liflandii (strain 128FXT) TaxID=459424 RepID=L7V4F9_MYCL1|nr:MULTISPECIES: DUF732 domain-containing protein [Mycobacterium ulcerans group]AGC61358.1 hypothetical protein MULP_01391 [Mycobacterium liflandii 128FXT]RFZ50935.1 hypothetical protein BB170200_05097 [Mycobacterium marinum]ULL09802.1 DUF732 domain-containing protein [Mycobacterium liflandii]